MAFNFLTTLYISVASSWALGRLNAQNGPRLKNIEAAGGEYGVPMPRAYGYQVRVVGAFIAQADIKETKHKLGGNQAIIGGAIGAVAGLVGVGVGALLGAATQKYYYTYSDTFAHLLLDRTFDDPIDLIGGAKIYANGKLVFSESPSKIEDEEYGSDGVLIWRKYHKNKYFKSLRIYTGHEEQDVDVDLAADVDEDGGYPFICYAVFEDFQLEDFGNSVPTFEYIIGVKSGETMASAAESICEAANIDPLREMSSTALVPYTLRGCLIASETSCWDALKPMLPVFGVDCADVSGQVRFYRRSQSMRSVITPDEMGGHFAGDSPPQKYMFRRETDLALPQETSLTFVDPDRNFQPNTATSTRTEGSAASNIAVTVNIVLSASEGASAAALMHWDAWLGRTSTSFTLTDDWLGIEAGVAYGIPIAGQVVPYRVTRKLRGAQGLIEVEALSDESVTYSASVAGSSGTVPPDESTEFAETRLVLMDTPITSDDHDEYGYYIAMGASEPGWTRGRIEISADGVTFVTVIDESEYAVMGDVTGTLAAGATDGLDDTLDTTTVLTVVLLHDLMVLESATDAELDNWANFAFVGKDGLGEYIQFKTATKVGTSTWELTNLRRGRRGTDHAISTHASGEEFALLGDGGVFRIIYPDTSQWGEEYTFRGVTLHQDSEDADEQTFTNTGEGKRPFSPVNVEGTWDGSNNLSLTADLRSRLFAGGLGIDDNNETDWEFFGGTGHSETVSGSAVTFSAAEQTAAGLTPGDTVTGRVRQTSDVNDGRWRNFTIVGPNALTFDSSLTMDETSYTWDAG